MKLRTIFERVIKEGNKAYLDLSEIASEFQIWEDYISEPDDCRIEAYWLGNWYCTDAIVGFIVYFFDGKPMAYSTQLGRKSNVDFYWASQKVAEDVKEYIKSLIEEEEEEVGVTTFDMDDDAGEGYLIDFSGQLFGGNHRARHNGRKVEILEKIKHTDLGIDTDLIIRYNDNKEQARVSIRELVFDFNVHEEDE